MCHFSFTLTSVSYIRKWLSSTIINNWMSFSYSVCSNLDIISPLLDVINDVFVTFTKPMHYIWASHNPNQYHALALKCRADNRLDLGGWQFVLPAGGFVPLNCHFSILHTFQILWPIDHYIIIIFQQFIHTQHTYSICNYRVVKVHHIMLFLT